MSAGWRGEEEASRLLTGSRRESKDGPWRRPARAERGWRACFGADHGAALRQQR